MRMVRPSRLLRRLSQELVLMVIKEKLLLWKIHMVLPFLLMMTYQGREGSYMTQTSLAWI
jgi:hypothetical protein